MMKRTMPTVPDNLTPMPSPCIGICRLSEAALPICTGCKRTIAEISQWLTMSQAEQKQIWQRIIQN
jgi:uncharacterized protein